MRHGPLLCFGVLLATTLGVCASAPPAAAQNRAKPPAGTLGIISGVVKDSGGVPQLGATVELLAEAPGIIAARQLLTNTQGIFRAENLQPGLYTVRVTLAGFLPAFEKHIQITSNLTTVVRIELESLYASIETLRRAPANAPVEADDWKWVLRSTSAMRPILQWREEETDDASTVIADTGRGRQLGRVDITGGARRPGSVSNIDSSPGTAFAYDQRIDRDNHVVFAGQVSYDSDAPSGGLAIMWLPTGAVQNGPRSTMVLRESKIGPDGPVFRGVRLEQSGTINIGDDNILRVGGEFVLVGAGSSAWNLRPRVNWETRLTPNWYVDALYVSLPADVEYAENAQSNLMNDRSPSILATALDQLDSFPALLWHNGKPVLENGRHEELAVERKFGARNVFQFAGFHDDNSHVALFGKVNDLPGGEYFQDFYSRGFAYDGGSSVTWGVRAALRERISDDLELTAIYAFSGALAPVATPEGPLRDALRTMPRQSAALKMSSRIPLSGTRVTAGYKWISGTALSRVDPYGESLYDVSPYLHVGIRQPLPWTILGRWEANAECDNLLAQGYVSMASADGQIVLVPAFRSFRGGLSLQF
ncbi:MAG TPA: carboxypeptidase-like regulatory domain-containing protein [Candidatus Saccharimonadales bacterium]|nr:carboxypeptidase-like regulatory domain-containing protein [Candidatus Saccharimonadales bacterium]